MLTPAAAADVCAHHHTQARGQSKQRAQPARCQRQHPPSRSCAFDATGWLLIGVIELAVLVVLIIGTAFATHFVQSYGVYLDPSMLRNTLHTDVAEARELCHSLADSATQSNQRLSVRWAGVLQGAWSSGKATLTLQQAATDGQNTALSGTELACMDGGVPSRCSIPMPAELASKQR